MVQYRGQFTHGIDAWLQIGDQDLAIGIGGAVQVVAAILDLGDAERDPGQPGAVAAQLDELERRFDVIGENELGIFIGLQLDDTLGLVDHIAVTGFFSHYIGARGEHGKVDFSIFVRPELLGSIGPLHRFDLEYSVGDDLGGVIGIHLHQPQSRLDIVEEQQLLNAVSGVELYLLGGGVQNVPLIAGIYFKRPVSAGLHIGEQNLAELVRLEIA